MSYQIIAGEQARYSVETMCRALGWRSISGAAELLHHTDRGSQYTADDYLSLLRSRDIQISKSDRGDSYDNAMMENFVLHPESWTHKLMKA